MFIRVPVVQAVSSCLHCPHIRVPVVSWCFHHSCWRAFTSRTLFVDGPPQGEGSIRWRPSPTRPRSPITATKKPEKAGRSPALETEKSPRIPALQNHRVLLIIISVGLYRYLSAFICGYLYVFCTVHLWLIALFSVLIPIFRLPPVLRILCLNLSIFLTANN